MILSRKKPQKTGAEGYAQISDCYVVYLLCFIISSDFDVTQHFSRSGKTMECGQIFLLACRLLRENAQHYFIGQFKNLLRVKKPPVGKYSSGQTSGPG